MNKQAIESFSAGSHLPEKANYLWLIVDGVVKSYGIFEQGRTIILGFWGKQDVVGKSLSNVEPYFLQCLSDVRAIAIPSIQWNTIASNLLHRIQQIQQLSYIIYNPQITQRLWLLLEWLAEKFGSHIPEGLLINFILTRQDLADALGITKLTVIQILNRFELEGTILQLKDQHIVLKR